VPDYEAFYERVIVRSEHFAVAVLRSRGLITDYGMQMEAVSYIARMRRSQLSILLEGRGYFMRPSGLTWLAPGDIVESDQSRQESEGYAGSPCEAIVFEWSDVLGDAWKGPARISRIARSDVSALRSHVASIDAMAPEQWIALLGARLRALGHRASREVAHASPARDRLAFVFRALGDALSRIDRSPSLTDVADALVLTERQTLRQFKELKQRYDHPNDGWRDFIQDARLGSAMQLLSIPGVPLAQVARLAGYGSPVALSHAFAQRGADTPGTIARRIAERWA
jgi:AraC-like DNA-binding protein